MLDGIALARERILLVDVLCCAVLCCAALRLTVGLSVDAVQAVLWQSFAIECRQLVQAQPDHCRSDRGRRTDGKMRAGAGPPRQRLL
jgi:hypothetical protein